MNIAKDLNLKLRSPDIHATGIRNLLQCPRSYFFQERLGLRQRGWYSRAFLVGSFYHAARAASLQSLNIDSAIAAELHNYERRIKDDTDPDTGLLPNGQDGTSAMDLVHQAAIFGAAMGHAATTFFPWPPTPSNWKVLHVEKKFRFAPYRSIRETGDDCIPRKGILDAVIMDQGDPPGIWVVEHKTDKDDPAVASRPYAFDYQLRLYVKLLRECLPDYIKTPLRGVMLDVIRKPTINQRTKRQPETFEEYVARVKQWYAGENLTSEKRLNYELAPPYLRTWLRFPDSDPELDNILCYAGKKVRSPHLFDFPRYPNACRQNYGLCPYLPLCEADPILWPSIIQDQFSTRSDPSPEQETPQ